MKQVLYVVLFASALSLTGCSALGAWGDHISNLQACRPAPKNPDLYSDHGGWDKQGIDDVRCSNEALAAVIAQNKTR